MSKLGAMPRYLCGICLSLGLNVDNRAFLVGQESLLHRRSLAYALYIAPNSLDLPGGGTLKIYELEYMRPQLKMIQYPAVQFDAKQNKSFLYNLI
jgi:hypothetical protein